MLISKWLGSSFHLLVLLQLYLALTIYAFRVINLRDSGHVQTEGDVDVLSLNGINEGGQQSWPGIFNTLPMTNGTSDGRIKRAKQRPAAFVSWVRTATELTFSTVYSVSTSCVKQKWGLADAYYRSGMPGNALLNWFEQELQNGEGADSWFNPVTWPDILQGATANSENFYSVQEGSDAVLSVLKITVPVDDTSWFDAEGVGSFIRDVANSMGLGSNVYSN